MGIKNDVQKKNIIIYVRKNTLTNPTLAYNIQQEFYLKNQSMNQNDEW